MEQRLMAGAGGDDTPIVPIGRARDARRPALLTGLRTIAVTSGKGGVGKTTLAANLATCFARAGARVLAVDGDLGLANLDLVLGVRPARSLADVVAGVCPIDDAIVAGPLGVRVLPACSGRYDLANLSAAERLGLFSAIDTLEDRFDALIVDTAAGIGSNAVAFSAAASDVIVVATPDTTSLADAYGMIKVLARRCRVPRVRVVANMVDSARAGDEVFRRLAVAADRFLDVATDYLGFVYSDDAVGRGVAAGEPFVIGFPASPAARCIEAIARTLASDATPAADRGGLGLFWQRLVGAGRPTPADGEETP